MRQIRGNMSRRDFVRFAGAGALGAAGMLSLGGSLGKAHAAEQETFKIVGGAEDLIEPIIKEFEATFGMKFEATLDTHAGIVNRMLTGGDKIFDAVECCMSFMQVLWDAGIFQPIPVEELKFFNDYRHFWVDPKSFGTDSTGWPAAWLFTDETKKFVKFAPQLWAMDTIAYNWEKVIPMPLTRMAIYDEKYAGKVGIWNDVAYGIRQQAFPLFWNGIIPGPKSGDINNLTNEEIDMVIEYLIEKKKQGQFRAVWDAFPQIVDLHTSGEVWISDAWQPAVLECQRRGAPIRYTYVWEGFVAWCHTVGIPKAASPEARRRALTFINWWNDGPPAKHICENGYLIATSNERAKKYLTEAQYKKWYLGQLRDCGPLEVQIFWKAWWDHWPENMKYMTKRWQQFLAA